MDWKLETLITFTFIHSPACDLLSSPLCFATINKIIYPVADPGFRQGGGQEFFPRFCRRSKAKSGEQSKQYISGI